MKKSKIQYTKRCEYCGKIFTTTNFTKKYCDLECNHNQQQKRIMQKRKTKDKS